MELSKRYYSMDVSSFNQLMETISTPGLVNFGSGSPASALLPSKELSAFAEKLLRDDGARLLQYGPARGLPEMLAAYHSYLSQLRGIQAALDETVIVNGGTQGIELICQALLDPGDVVLVESPTFKVIFMILQKLGVRCVCVETDHDGVILTDLEKKIKRYHPKLLYLIPTFQNSSGIVLSKAAGKQYYSYQSSMAFIF